MTPEAFRASLAGETAPDALDAPLAALWRLARGDWAGAHELAQSEDTLAARWVHAHLHRVEGDVDNAAYWYARARKPFPRAALEEEWAALVAALL